MDATRAIELYHKYSSAMVYIDVEKPNGSRDIGSAFHIGSGIYITARHVVENNNIIEIKSTEPVSVGMEEIFTGLSKTRIEEGEKELKERLGFIPTYNYWTNPLLIDDGPLFN